MTKGTKTEDMKVAACVELSWGTTKHSVAKRYNVSEEVLEVWMNERKDTLRSQAAFDKQG